MTSLPHRLIRGNPDLSLNEIVESKSLSGTTVITAGEYKGKGSLELYMPQPSPSHRPSSYGGQFAFIPHSAIPPIHPCESVVNRQTASSSKLLSVAPHGLKLVFSDGNAKLKWVERNGITPVREFSINPAARPSGSDADDTSFADQGIFGSDLAADSGDIVQKILPSLRHEDVLSSGATTDIHQDNLIIWTGDGRLGMVGFGKNCGWDSTVFDEVIEKAEDEGRLQEELQYGRLMKEALRRHANEARFMTGLGLPLT